MGSNKRKNYSKEFKLNAVKMVTEEGRRAAEVARDLGISENLIYNWKRAYLEEEQQAFRGKGKMTAKEEYIRKIERENKRLKDERDILKKAAAFFAKEP